MDDSTRDSGSFSKLSDSDSSSTTCGGVPRSASSKHGRRRRSSRYGRVVVYSASLFRSFTRCRRTPVDRCRWRRRVGSARPRPPVNSTQHTCSRLCTDVLLELTSERLNCSKTTDVRSTTINSLEIRAHFANCR